MSIDTETRTVPRLDIKQIEDDLEHLVCEIHDRVAFRGTAFGQDSEECWDISEITCPLCVEAAEEGVVCVVPGCPGGRSTWGRFVHRITGGRRG